MRFARVVFLALLGLAVPVHAENALPDDDVAASESCALATKGYLDALMPGNFSKNPYFDCFRRNDEVFTFVSTMLQRVPALVTSNFTIATSYQGRDIQAYRITLASGAAEKQLMYIQALQHAREWIATTSTVYALARLLDGVATQDTTIIELFAAYDWCIVPIVNVDGYIDTWKGNRLRRKNMRACTNGGNATDCGVDLNRNWGPSTSFRTGDGDLESEVYPGNALFSEPETKGIHNWLTARNTTIVGALDVHTFGGWVLSPYGNNEDQPAPPFGNAFATLTNAIRRAMGPLYLNQRSVQLYPVYGGFGDYMFMTYGAPALTLEMDGHSFNAPAASIRARGDELFAGVVLYARKVPTWIDDAVPTPAPPNPVVISRHQLRCLSLDRCHGLFLRSLL
uniref:Secreted protein n=1 Tax=Achlya hypogyna TaxID=1202772 RepID=A0A0A7CMS9_ACHHY|nr:secreted protein [Achlya hypogyna]